MLSVKRAVCVVPCGAVPTDLKKNTYFNQMSIKQYDLYYSFFFPNN